MNQEQQRQSDARRNNQRLYEEVREIRRTQEPQIRRDSGRVTIHPTCATEAPKKK